MARRVDDVQVQLSMPSSLRAKLGKTALDHQSHVPSDRVMDRGSMILYALAVFLELPPEEQLQTLLKGKAIYAEKWEPTRGPSRMTVEESLEYMRSLAEKSKASPATNPPSTVTQVTRKFPDAPQDAGQGLDGEKPAVSKGNKRPPRKGGR